MKFTDEKIAGLLAKVNKFIDQGKSTKEALKASKVSAPNYYRWTLRKKKKRAPLLQVAEARPVTPTQGRVVCVIGSPNDIASVIRGMRS